MPAPAVGGLSASPGSVAAGAAVTLVASGVAESGGSVAGVSFYLDADGNAAWDSGDRLIGTSSSISGGQASLSFNTAGMAAGSFRFFARAVDAAGVWSGAAAATLTVTPPVKSGTSVGTAIAVNVGATVGGSLTTTTEVDWYKFQAVAGTRYVLQTSLGSLADSYLTLYAADGKTVLARNDDIAPTNYASRIVWQAPANGAFYAAVSSFAGEYAGSYNLQIAIKSPPVLSPIANQTMPAGGALTLTVGGASSNGLPLSYWAQTSAAANLIAIGVSGNVVTIRPQAAFTGNSFAVTVYVSDGYQTASRTFTVALTARIQNQTKASTAPSTSPVAPGPPLGRQTSAAYQRPLAAAAVDAVYASIV